MNRNSDELSQPADLPNEEEQGSAHGKTVRRKSRASSRSSTTAPQEEEKVSSVTMKPTKKRKWKRPKDMPKRPLSAYNIFFHYERERLMHEKDSADMAPGDKEESEAGSKAPSRNMGFVNLSRTVASRWHALDSEAKVYYEQEAEKEQARYERELGEWKRAAVQANRPEEKHDEQAMLYSQDARLIPPDRALTQQDSDGMSSETLQQSLSLQQLLWLGLPQSSMRPSTEPSPATRAAYPTVTQPIPTRVAASTHANLPQHSSNPSVPTASLQQLMSELDDDEKDFLASLKEAP